VLHRQGLGQRAIAQALGVGRHTIRTFLRTGAFPERRARTTSGTILTPFDPYLRERWDAGWVMPTFDDAGWQPACYL